jgi:transcriptional regulator with XRE-family HTH domain
MDPARFGQLVESARKRKGLTQAELARVVGVQPPQISRIESGSKGVSTETLVAIAEALDIDLNLLKSDPLGEAPTDPYPDLLADLDPPTVA